jgi:hypothetical protein
MNKTILTEDENAAFIRRIPNLEEGGADIEELPTADGAQGVWFTCPLADCGHMQMVWFENPLNAEKVLGDKPYPRWKRIGETLGTLTLHPSIHNVSPDGCGWHGWVKNGVAR